MSENKSVLNWTVCQFLSEKPNNTKVCFENTAWQHAYNEQCSLFPSSVSYECKNINKIDP